MQTRILFNNSYLIFFYTYFHTQGSYIAEFIVMDYTFFFLNFSYS